MTDHILPKRRTELWRFTPRQLPTLDKHALEPCVRVYRNDPETVSLQIRNEKGYAHVALSFDQARQVAAFLEEEAQD